MQKKTIQQKFSVSFDYPVTFTRDLFETTNPVLRDTLCRRTEDRPGRALVFLDQGVATATPDLAERICAYFSAYEADLTLVKAPHVVLGGEAIKNDYRLVMEIVDTVLEYRLCRHSFVVAIGGGAMLDAVGFAASLVHRGLRTVRVPSTTLAQNDAGVGVKNGMNLHGGKNTIGTFHPPFAVLNDSALLETLPQAHWIGGVAEAFKVAVIKDALFFHALCKDAKRFRQRDVAAQERMIVRCAEWHLDHIRTQGDPFEMGRARPLDFGHWAAHKLESMSNYRIPHGEAVAVGMAIDASYAAAQGWLAETDCAALIQGLIDTGFTMSHSEMGRCLGDGRLELLGGLDDFREHLGGQLCVTFPDGLGRKQEIHTIDHACMERVIRDLNGLPNPVVAGREKPEMKGENCVSS